MTKNMGKTDRVFRILAAAAVGILYLAGEISGTAAAILGIFATVFILTSLIGSCPLYLPFKLSTVGTKKGAA